MERAVGEPVLGDSWVSISSCSSTPWKCFLCAAVSDVHCCAERKPHTASLVLCHGERAEFDVLFKPSRAQRVEGKISLSVVNNPFEETNIQLVGEGYEGDFTLDNIHGLVADSKEESSEDSVEAEMLEGKGGEAGGLRTRQPCAQRQRVLCCVSLCTATATRSGTCQGVSLAVVGWGAASPRGRKPWSGEELDMHVSVHVRGRMELTPC